MRAQVENYIHHHYDAQQEYPWAKYPRHTTFKHPSNHKWFALIMDVPYRKLHLDRDGNVEIINVKTVPEMVAGLVAQTGILPAYHMNKEHWITILLDGSVAAEQIYGLIDVSYELTTSSANVKQVFNKC